MVSFQLLRHLIRCAWSAIYCLLHFEQAPFVIIHSKTIAYRRNKTMSYVLASPTRAAYG